MPAWMKHGVGVGKERYGHKDAAEATASGFFKPGEERNYSHSTPNKEQEAAAGNMKEERKGLAELVVAPAARIVVSMSDRPFGIVTSKAEGVGYLVAKATDGKPAAKAGVRPGWRVVGVGSKSCDGQSFEEIQAALKGAALPVTVEFETFPSNFEFCTSCHQLSADFSRKMRTRPIDKRRCIACVEASPEKEVVEGVTKADTAVEERKPLCAERAKQGELVAGHKVGYAGHGKGKGRR
eukprot:gnl/MRDRNA2_/MRDRNA2_206775_c0_seq1.p1 gnl/MRDRNA2_/MRDRNA2_206775_c0~~gnl/MRDRNA2_/MRDRNA2_206775_c0_seq1.p1  ORF type:complete len:238 (-),score=48.71 gnl/MRDRNA2_/MRDRNA2_206775_c0_seq1:143-856(-)